MSTTAFAMATSHWAVDQLVSWNFSSIINNHKLLHPVPDPCTAKSPQFPRPFVHHVYVLAKKIARRWSYRKRVACSGNSEGGKRTFSHSHTHTHTIACFLTRDPGCAPWSTAIGLLVRCAIPPQHPPCSRNSGLQSKGFTALLRQAHPESRRRMRKIDRPATLPRKHPSL